MFINPTTFPEWMLFLSSMQRRLLFVFITFKHNFVSTKSELVQFSVIIMLNELHLGFYHPSNDTKNVVYKRKSWGHYLTLSLWNPTWPTGGAGSVALNLRHQFAFVSIIIVVHWRYKWSLPEEILTIWSLQNKFRLSYHNDKKTRWAKFGKLWNN